MDGPRYQQILRDRGGRLEIWPPAKPQAARLTITRPSNTALATAVSDATAQVVSLSIAIAGSGAAVAATEVTLANVKGVIAGQTYYVRNQFRQEEPVVFEKVNTSTLVCTLADTGGFRFAYAVADTLRQYRCTYEITTDVAESEDVEESFRCRWKVVQSENDSVDATGGTTTTVTMLDADAANAYVGCPMVIELDTDGFYFEERVVTAIASAGGTTTLTFAAMSEAPDSGDDVWIGEDVELVWYEHLFDIVHQIIVPALTIEDCLVRWPALRDYEWTETEGTNFKQQIDLAFERTLQDARRLTGKRPHLIIGASESLKEATWFQFLKVCAMGSLMPAWAQEMEPADFWQQLRDWYNAELEEALKNGGWYDEDEDQSIGAGETNLAYGLKMRR